MSGAVHLAKTLLAETAVRSGALQRWHRRRPPHVLVLAYHRVTPDAELAAAAYPAMHVSTSSFEAQLAALQELYRVVPLPELRALLAGSAPLEAPVAVVTFDDGYRDNYQHALPILVRRQVPATFFLSLDFVAAQRGFWFDRLAAAAAGWQAAPAVRETLRPHLPEPLAAALDGPAPRSERLRAAAAFLKRLPDAERQAAMQVLEALAPAAPGCEPLRWSEVQALREAGMHVGAHGVQHAILTRLPPQAARLELTHSLRTLSERLGTEVCDFAYPNGDADDGVARLAAEAGVRLGFTMQPAALRPGADLMRLGRRNVCEETSRDAFGRFSRPYFFCEITGVFDALLRRASRAR
jgi:peptidoglycan/xylan/chitin deacetylase (PgdA/CDA1 family)